MFKNMLEHMPEHSMLNGCLSNASRGQRTHARTYVRTTHLGRYLTLGIARRGAAR